MLNYLIKILDPNVAYNNLLKLLKSEESSEKFCEVFDIQTNTSLKLTICTQPNAVANPYYSLSVQADDHELITFDMAKNDLSLLYVFGEVVIHVNTGGYTVKFVIEDSGLL